MREQVSDVGLGATCFVLLRVDSSSLPTGPVSPFLLLLFNWSVVLRVLLASQTDFLDAWFNSISF